MFVCKVDPGVEAVFEEQPSEDFELPRNLCGPNERSMRTVIWLLHEGGVCMLGGEGNAVSKEPLVFPSRRHEILQNSHKRDKFLFCRKRETVTEVSLNTEMQNVSHFNQL